MILCRVIGTIVATHKNSNLDGNKLLVVQPVDLEGNYIGNNMVAVDRVNAGEDDLVLVIKEGGGARILFNNAEIPLQLVIVAVVDNLDVPDVEMEWPQRSAK